MDITMRVNRVSTHPVEVPVTYAGQDMKAMMPELEVELFHEHGTHGSLTLHFRTAAEIADAKAAFVQGSEITLHVAGAAAAPEMVETTADTEHAGA